MLSGVSGLEWAVGYGIPEKPRLEHLRQGSGIVAPALFRGPGGVVKQRDAIGKHGVER